MATTFNTPRKPNSSTSTIYKVRVILRVRPFLSSEINGNPISCVSSHFDSATDDVSVFLKDPNSSRHECYKLDAYYGEEDNSLAKIFEKEVKPLIPSVFHGCNATVFAYGATGSGKTYTMQGTDEQPGLMPLTMSAVLSICEATENVAKISYYEVYLDRCYDLFEPKAKEISVLDDREGQIHLRGLSGVVISSMSEFHEVFTRGRQKRKVAHTGLNDVSSRSHGVLVITVSAPNGNGLEVMGKLNLIDLAGNEDNNKSGNEGIRMQESAKINQSLFALSNVIYALNSNKSWVPYRESKLTRILQDSLGGTSRALMVACLNPSDYYESVHTVSLASRSRQISNMVPSAQTQETPKVKIDMEKKLQAWLESKGKTKSVQRFGAFGSPFFLKTSGSVRSVKKQAQYQSSVKSKAGNQVTSAVEDRFLSLPQLQLCYSEAPSSSGKEDLMDIRDCLRNTNDLMLFEDGHTSSNSAAFSLVKVDRCLSEVQELVAKDTIETWTMNGTEIKARAASPVEDEKSESKGDNFFQSPERCKGKGYQSPSPFREALSPMDANKTMPMENISSSRNANFVLLEANTSRTPFVVTRERLMDFNTPLDKFNARSSNIKSFLAEEYIDFLNAATRDELVKLKGIGIKRAGYIMELRETSPLKSLSDLEKIGLSSKQVQHIFSKAAEGVFE